jgi:large subunit ribosomal protein L31
MKADLHPTWYPDAQVVCQCGNTWTTGATVPEIRTEICSNCHPFFTGEQRIVDTEGRVDIFYKRLQRRDNLRKAREAQQDDTPQPEQMAVADLDLDEEIVTILTDNGLETIADVLNILEANGDDGLAELDDMSQARVIELKKAIRAQDIDVPTA